jgi:hypothetical protein
MLPALRGEAGIGLIRTLPAGEAGARSGTAFMHARPIHYIGGYG